MTSLIRVTWQRWKLYFLIVIPLLLIAPVLSLLFSLGVL